MRFPQRLLLVALLMAALASTTTFAKTKFKSVWKSPDAHGATFGGKKVAALIIDKDESLRISREELQNADKARVWYEQAGVEGVVAFRLVSDEQRRTWQPSSWSSPYYGSLWGYYGYGWGTAYDPGYIRDDRVISLETLIFSVPKNVLLWAGMSETENPKNAAAVVAEVVKEAAKELKKQGLARSAKS
jgi:hypothetical protein